MNTTIHNNEDFEQEDSINKDQNESMDVEFRTDRRQEPLTEYERLIEEAMQSNPTRLSYMRQGFQQDDHNSEF